MVTRKPLPANAAVDTKLISIQQVQGIMPSPQDTPNAASTNEGVDPPIEASDSDVDSWERASASDSDKEQEETNPEESKETEALSAQKKVPEEEAIVTQEGGSTTALPVAQRQEEDKASNAPSNTASTSSPAETNPFRRKISQSNGSNTPNNAAITLNSATAASMPPTEDLANLSLSGEQSTNPWQPALDEQQKALGKDVTLPVAVPDQEGGQNVWASQVPSRAASTGPIPSDPDANTNAKDADSFETPPEESASWYEEPPDKTSIITVPESFRKSLEGHKLEEESHAWDEVATASKGKEPMLPVEDAWNETVPGSSGAGDTSQPLGHPDEKASAPAFPPRPAVSGKTETYQVKNINWSDTELGANGTRKTPILIQNANGPCPLMALVNALTLTTPASASEESVLVHTLRTREQISLNLLLEAVFEELMSERRLPPDQYLPDVTQLYGFLKGLHTGMNVNPRFIPTEEVEKAFKRTSLTHLHPSERGDLIPGTFEETIDMSFYRTFQIPLIHGWLPSKEEPVYEALKRCAESYEDAQNMLFREEDLEYKLSAPDGEGLSESEQNMYQDILSIKDFLHSSATQLTPWGLEVITKAMRPGSVAILFRNDHFSTLYRHPQTLQIFTVVTDAGYAGHAEVVWESLADINGERSEFFSGDFRVVGGQSQAENPPSNSRSSMHSQGEWTTVHDKKSKATKDQSDEPPLSPKEQEDRDLALALQLQEEEDQRHRSEQAQRRRESQLSEQFIEQQARRSGPVGLPRTGATNGNSNQNTPTTGRRASGTSVSTSRSGNTNGNGGRSGRPAQQQQIRPLVPPVLRSRGVNRPSDAADGEDAPPSYEDAARERAYVPPAGHPSHPNSTPNSSVSALRLPGSRAPGVAGVPQSPSAGSGRRGSSYRQGVAPPAGTKEKDCVVM